MKEWSRRGDDSGRERAGVEERLVCRLKCSFEILSDKYVRNSCEARGDDVGRKRLAVLCMILF